MGLWSFVKSIFGGSSQPAATMPFKARLYPGPPLSVSKFVDLKGTPGRVGVCLSGGGSRALTGAMGQLRALRNLKTANGLDLISQTRVLSTVSGGSWLGVTFQYLTAGTSDDDYLNRLVEDPGRLVPTKKAGHSQAETLDELPPGNIGNSIATRAFGPGLLGIQVLLLHKFAKVPTPFLWQTAIAIHVLKPYGLFDHNRQMVPTSLFTYDADTHAKDVVGPNPGLAAYKANLFASGTGRSRRPFLLCNMAMFLQEPNTRYKMMAPVQSTPFATGIFGKQSGTDFNGVMAGGGGVSSFAFSSTLSQLMGEDGTVEQTRQLALMDIVGTSSAFYAEVLQNLFATWRDNLDMMLDELLADLDVLVDWVDKVLPGDQKALAMAILKHPMMGQTKTNSWAHKWVLGELKKWIDEVRDLTPAYTYWPVAGAMPSSSPLKVNTFADGGDLENTGVASLLSYEDVDRVIAFVNSSKPMVACSLGMFDAEGKEVPGTRVFLDGQMPVLFGYQPWQEGVGYRLYQGATNPAGPQFQNNQVFKSEAFAELLKGLWSVTGNSGDPAELGLQGKETRAGANQRPAILRQELEVVPNAWFGVGGNRTVTVVWSYTNRVKAFYDALAPEVQQIIGNFDDPKSFAGWPHYSTVNTHLTATQINLLSSLTAWSVANPIDRKTFLDLFEEG
jgi:hypothetical protein